MRISALLAMLVLASPILVPRQGTTAQPFVRGDADRSNTVELTDAVVIVNALFLGRGRLVCEDSADSNDDGTLDITDPTFLLNFLFRGGPVLPPPFPDAGKDPTNDPLPCASCGDSPSHSSTALCGPDALSCQLLEDVLIQEETSFRNGAPSITLGEGGLPHVVFPFGTEMYYGGRDTKGSWAVAAMVDAKSGEVVQGFHGEIVESTHGLLAWIANSGGINIWRRDEAGSWLRSGEVRFIFSRIRRTGKLVATCPEKFNPGSCSTRREVVYDADLRVGWLEGDSIEQRVLLEGTALYRARATVAADGSVHLVGFDHSTGESRVRYVRFGG